MLVLSAPHSDVQGRLARVVRDGGVRAGIEECAAGLLVAKLCGPVERGAAFGVQCVYLEENQVFLLRRFYFIQLCFKKCVCFQKNADWRTAIACPEGVAL